MRKDIFIDTNIAKNFSNPKDIEYKKLIAWLIKFDENIPKNENAHLVVSDKILQEYGDSSRGAKSTTTIANIINRMWKQGRRIKFNNKQINDFQNKYFTKTVTRTFNLHIGNKDREHVPIILMSDRKLALIIDTQFRNTINNFPRFNAKAESKPYEEFYK